MSRLLAGLVLFVIAVLALGLSAQAQTQQAVVSPERWFAIAFDAKGSRHHLGPFPSLEACETARLKILEDANARERKIYVEAGLDRERSMDRASRDAAGRTYAQRLLASDIPEQAKLGEFWRDKGICERK